MSTDLTPGARPECPGSQDLMAYMDDELDAETAATIEEHVRHCGRCREWLESQSHLEGVYRESYAEPADRDFDAFRWRLDRHLGRAARKWRARTGRGSRFMEYFRPGVLVPAAAAVLAVIVGLRLLLPPGESILDEVVGRPGTVESVGGRQQDLPGAHIDGEPADLPSSGEEQPVEEAEELEEGAEAPEGGFLDEVTPDSDDGTVFGAASDLSGDEIREHSRTTGSGDPAVVSGDVVSSSGLDTTSRISATGSGGGGSGAVGGYLEGEVVVVEEISADRAEAPCGQVDTCEDAVTSLGEDTLGLSTVGGVTVDDQQDWYRGAEAGEGLVNVTLEAGADADATVTQMELQEDERSDEEPEALPEEELQADVVFQHRHTFDDNEEDSYGASISSSADDGLARSRDSLEKELLDLAVQEAGMEVASEEEAPPVALAPETAQIASSGLFLTIYFDENGVPHATLEALESWLDAHAAGWRDSMVGYAVDTLLVFSADDLLSIIYDQADIGGAEAVVEEASQ